MHPFFHQPHIRRARVIFRWCRILLWLVLLAVVGAVSYLHLVGLPDFLKQPLLGRLSAEGLAAEFAGMRLDWKGGPSILIDSADFRRAHQPLSPRLFARHAELVLSREALLHARLQVLSLQIADGYWELPTSETNGGAFVLNRLSMDIRFDTNDTARIDVCRGTFHGIQIDLIGKVRHLSALSGWKFPEGGAGGASPSRLQEAARTLQKIRFGGTPVLQIETGADGRDQHSFHAEMNLLALDAHTPWGDASSLDIHAACARLGSPGEKPFLQVEGSAARLATEWAGGRQVSFLATIAHGADSNLNAEIRFDANNCAASNGLAALRLSWHGRATLAASNLLPLRVEGKLHAEDATTPWGRARELSLDLSAARAANAAPVAPEWGPWAKFAPWTLDWQTDLRGAANPQLRLDRLAFSGHWQAPQLVVTNLHTDLYGGHAEAAAALDIDSRELHCQGATDFDPHAISPLLTPAASNWLAQLDWTSPPKVSAQLRVVLNPWTRPPGGPTNDIAASLQVAGDFAMGPASFQQVRVLSAAARVSYTNGTWTVSHLRATRPDGAVELDYSSSLQTQDYRFTIDSQLDPRDVLPLLLAQKPPPIVDEVGFHQPPVIHAEVRGCWSDPARLDVAGTILATNFTLRGEPMAGFGARVAYTNLLLTIHDLNVSGNECQVLAPWLQADLGAKTGALTNVTGRVGVPFLLRLLRDNPPDFLESIRFEAPAGVSASGSFCFTNQELTDLHFQVNGRGFHYNALSADDALGHVDWIGRSVYLTNIVAGLYGGTAMGWLSFISRPVEGSDFRGDFTARDINLSPLATGLAERTNHVEGRLDGDLYFGGPNTADKSQWFGQGHVHVHDALLWDIKVFGLLSPVLNLFSPGWGHSRAREAMADFTITNNVISSSNLYIRCTGFRINVRGDVTLDKKINARMEARLSRETPIIGPVLSMAFTPLSKIFEYHVSGTLQNPSMEPIYVPRFITFLLHPFRSLKTPATPEPAPAPDNPK